jgi:hypothetical protein
MIRISLTMKAVASGSKRTSHRAQCPSRLKCGMSATAGRSLGGFPGGPRLVECAFPEKTHVPSCSEDVIIIGQALIRQKAALPHDSFLPPQGGWFLRQLSRRNGDDDAGILVASVTSIAADCRRIAGHVRGMINQTKTTVIFACAQCNLAHEVTQTHSHTKKAGGFDCADCGAAVHFWYGFFDYSDWGVVNMNSMTFTHPNALGRPNQPR